MLAVRLIGSATAVDWLPPSDGGCDGVGRRAPPAGASGGISSVAAPHVDVVSCRGVIVRSLDAANNLWVADAVDTAAISVLSGGSSRVQALRAWGRTHGAALSAMRQRVQQLLGGGQSDTSS
jgi:hypothetical protein